MEGRRRLISIAALLSILLVVPLVLGLGIVDVPRLSFESPPSAVESTSTATVFVDPDKIIKDYLMDPGYQIGDTFTVHVNVSEATDLFAWQVNVTWNTNILNFTGMVSYGDFLARTTSPNGTSRIVDPILDASNATGYATIAETILGEYPGINGSGRLVTVEFLVVDYGWTHLNVSVGGTLPTMLLDSAGGTVTYDKADGYFSNKLFGDVEGDRDVDYDDFIVLAGAYGSSSGQPAYDERADFDRDGDVDYDDFIVLAGNYGKSV